MDFRIVDYGYSALQDEQIASLLIRVFVGEGYSDRTALGKTLACNQLRRRGEILLAKSATGDLAGMIICAPPSSPARQVAELDEAEMHLLAVDPAARRNGVAAALVAAFEKRAYINGFRKAVLSTQPVMSAAHRVYERCEYQRNPSRDWSKSDGRRYLVYQKNL